jgi:hypothetical protein
VIEKKPYINKVVLPLEYIVAIGVPVGFAFSSIFGNESYNRFMEYIMNKPALDSHLTYSFIAGYTALLIAIKKHDKGNPLIL